MSRPPRSHPPSPLFGSAPPPDRFDSPPQDPGRTERSTGWASRAGKSTARSAGSAPARSHLSRRESFRMSTLRKSPADRELRWSKGTEVKDTGAEKPGTNLRDVVPTPDGTDRGREGSDRGPSQQIVVRGRRPARAEGSQRSSVSPPLGRTRHFWIDEAPARTGSTLFDIEESR